ncbi:MAG: YihA family ribosome biogenesis GTP-binding protein [Bacteroidia bacterium]|nr:YihA family ribosome biogenesis GTP-binding protein [Bacteroidia bacterium]
MEIKKATFKGSWERADQMPDARVPEFAFIGRSNVGKSSLINMLCNHKGLAKTSAQPGKTQTLNLFDIDNKWWICDLPGYGYAKVSKEKRFKFSKMIEHYLQKRENLVNLFILIDLRIPPQKLDLDFINWCGENGIPFMLVGTKADKLSPTQVALSQEKIEAALSEVWVELPPFQISSSETKQGRKEILNFIQECMGSVN